MSLIIAYVGKKGCVMASDKRRIAYFGDKENREKLEEEIYSGAIKNDEDLKKRSDELDITLKISDDANKIRYIENVIVGEVSSRTTFETRRKRIYGTTYGYQIIEMLGSDITHSEKGENAIILFGNKISKAMANDLISKKWKSSFSLKYMGEIFESVLEEVASKTPSLGKKCDVMIVHPELDKKSSQKYLDETIKRDVQLLGKWREKLKNDLLEQNETVQLAAKIINEGDIGLVSNTDGPILQVTLNKDVKAYDTNWKQLAKPGEVVVMISNQGDVEIGDEVVIENEILCIKRNKSSLKCDIILCDI
ncbi:MAG: DUF2121 domain-containing protein [Methanobrevibacter arboriphilus]|jgi:hypothetical protein|uniref:Uncharacterized protein n=2 Tax=Methanobrevibacter arboriphilus TaxID=39441 RepID=A0ACA8R2C8_METAZ|nr:DUF2121 domain-containing protein [Methanobrevibacter arboriphilus]MBF4469277.1 DUF2121 domain-containing protein [Methanobrevibacter arboriphilus]BBL61369.1 hypothetical protein MarbSA_04090 [Methanobrevibacter arboriphilus]GLI11295.1 hypothetical protein MARBORIA2_03850 [Methanobrevibacter arboriphilus]